MTIYLLRRVGYSITTLAVLLIVVFFLSFATGDPAVLMAGPEGTAEQIAAIRQQYGLNDPIHVQFGRAALGWLHGDFGNSLWQGRPALSLALERLPATLYLASATLLLAVPLAVLMGAFAAIRPRSLIDRGLTVLAITGVSLPNFWLGLMLILVVAVQLRWLPTSGMGTWQHVLLPAITLALPHLGQLSQIARSAVMSELNKQYMMTAKAKGLAPKWYLFRHALPNAGIPILTVAGNELATLISGAVIVETVFGWPGVGQLLIQAIERRDLPLVIAVVFVIAVFTLTLNIIIDLMYMKMDPRIKLGGAS